MADFITQLGHLLKRKYKSVTRKYSWSYHIKDVDRFLGLHEVEATRIPKQSAREIGHAASARHWPLIPPPPLATNEKPKILISVRE